MSKKNIYISTFGESRINRSENLSILIRDINKYDVLSQEKLDDLYKEIELCQNQKWQEETYNYIVNCNLRLVLSMAKRYATTSAELDDLMQVGSIGLILGVKKYDYHVGALFTAFVLHYIRREITSYKLGNKTVIKTNNVKTMSANKIANEFFKENEREATKEEMLELYNKYNKKYKLNDSNDFMNVRCLSLDDYVEGDDEFNPLQTEYDNATSNDNEVKKTVSSEYNQFLVSSLLNTLTKREQKVVNGLFGVNGEKASDIDDLAKDLNLTRERVRQIKFEAIAKMQQIVKEHAIAR